MSRQTLYRCDRCMVAFDPLSLRRLDNRYRVTSPSLDGEMDLCEPCLSDLDAWVRAPLEDDAERGAIDFTTGMPA